MKRLLIMGAVLAAACGGGDPHNHEEAEEHGHEHGHEGEITMCPTEQKANGVVAVKMQSAPFAEVLHTSGRIVAAAQGQIQVSAPVGGMVSGLAISAGRKVSSGSRLLTITVTEQQKRSALIELDAARIACERLERLANDRLVGAEELEAARTRLRQAEVVMQCSSMMVNVPATGTLQSLAVANGQVVEAGDPIATLTTDGKAAQLEVKIPVHYSGVTYTSARYNVAGQVGTASIPVGVTSQVDEDGCIRATFTGITATAPIGSYCEVWLMGTQRDGVLSVPQSALTESQGIHYIYIREDADCFRRQAVTLGASDGERVEITSGVKAGDMVVAQGAYAVKAAGQSAAIPGHTHNH